MQVVIRLFDAFKDRFSYKKRPVLWRGVLEFFRKYVCL